MRSRSAVLVVGLGVLGFLAWFVSRPVVAPVGVEPPAGVAALAGDETGAAIPGTGETEAVPRAVQRSAAAAGEQVADSPPVEASAPNVRYKRVGAERSGSSRLMVLPVLDDEWLEHGTRAGMDQEEALELDPAHPGGFVVHVGGGPCYYSLGSLPASFLQQQLRLEDCVLDVRIAPELLPAESAKVRIGVRLGGSEGLQLHLDELRCYDPPADLAPVNRYRSYDLSEAQCITDLHPATDYYVWAEEPESPSPPGRLREFTDLDVTTPASVLVPWTYPETLTVVLVPPTDKAGDLMLAQVGRGFFQRRGEVRSGRAVMLAKYLPRGELEVGAKGDGWASTGEVPLVTVRDGKPSTPLVEIAWRETSIARVRFETENADLGKPLFRLRASAEKYVPFREFEDPTTGSSFLWSSPNLTINDLAEAVDLCVYFPRAGEYVWLALKPTDDVVVRVDTHPRRVLEAARQVARDWLDDPEILGSYCSIDLNIAKPGDPPQWLQVHQENTRLSDAFDAGTWEFAWMAEGRYRVRLSGTGVQGELIREL